jgi:hypothetical protein
MHLGGLPQSSRLTAAYGVGKQRLPRRRAVCGRREDVLPRAVRKGAPGQRDAGGWAGDGRRKAGPRRAGRVFPHCLLCFSGSHDAGQGTNRTEAA